MVKDPRVKLLRRWVRDEMTVPSLPQLREVLERVPDGRTPIGCRWVFKLKRKPDGTVDRYKGRLVGKGFSQRPGLDFDQTFSPTAKWAALRAILALVALEDLECISVDISRAFLNGDMEHDVYMDYFQGYEELGFGKRKPGSMHSSW